MSFKGVIEARCPQGCEPFEAEVWSFIHGGNDQSLRDAIIAKECNLILCPACQAAFFAEVPYVYFEPAAEIVAFVFPESFRKDAGRWRIKMNEDFEALRKTLGSRMPLHARPELFFGPDELSDILARETYRGEECEVMEFVAKELGLSIYRVRPSFARRSGIPASLPYAPAAGEGMTRDNLRAGLSRLLAANDRLSAFRDFLKALDDSKGEALPPARDA